MNALIRGVWFYMILLVGLYGNGHATLPERTLWYDQPARYFEEVLPLGNGRIGAAIYGGVGREHLLLNEITLWTGKPVDPYMNPDAYTHLPEIRQALFNQDYPLADSLVRQLQGKFSESYAPLGDLFIDMHHDTAFRDYRRELDIRRGVATVAYTVNDVHYHREVFVSHPDQVVGIRLEADRQQCLDFTLRLSSQLKYSVSVREKDLIMDGRTPVHAEPSYRGDMPDAVRYEAEKGTGFRVIVHIAETDGKVRTESNQLTITDASGAVILVSLATSFNGFNKNPDTEGRNQKALASDYLEKVVDKSFQVLKKRHTEEFRSFFDRVSLILGEQSPPDLPTDKRLKRYSEGEADPDLEALYFQFGRYLLISASRTPEVPANLQGIWNPYVRPPWSSNYTTNINVEMNYWSSETGNLSEMHWPLLSLISNLEKTGRITAETFFNCGGWCCGHNTDIWAMTNPVGDFGQGHPSWANWNLAGAWLSTHLWEHFAFTQDTSFLSNYAYPLMKGAAEFCLDWLVKDNKGYLVTAPSTSPENIYVTPDGYQGATAIGMTSDMAMIRELFNQTIQTSEILGRDSGFRQNMSNALEELYPYQIGSKGQLQEWYYDWQDADPQHRHLSHLFGLYPGHQITPEKTPELADACRRSLELRGDGGTGWSKAWKINCWARLREGNHAYKLLRTHLTYTPPGPQAGNRGGGTYPNLWDAHPPFQIDGNFGGAAGIIEMLVQSGKEEIYILPALPDVWPQGEVRGLCTRGGFEVDITWKEGKLEKTIIRSRTGKHCCVRYHDNSVDIILKPGESIELDVQLHRM